MLYRVVAGETENFEKEVNRLIEQGWKPQGGLCYSGGFFFQAMIKERK